MKKINRKQMVATAVLVFGIAAAGIGAVYAAETTGNGNPMSGLAAAIAQKFNLNQAEVQAVFDQHRGQMEARREEHRAEMEAKRQADFESKLGELVSNGKLTQAQADAIKAKRAEMQAQMETEKQTRQTEMDSIKNMSKEQRQAQMQARKTEMESRRAALEQWAADNGIPQEYLHLVNMGIGYGRGGKGFGGLKIK